MYEAIAEWLKDRYPDSAYILQHCPIKHKVLEKYLRNVEIPVTITTIKSLDGKEMIQFNYKSDTIYIIQSLKGDDLKSTCPRDFRVLYSDPQMFEKIEQTLDNWERLRIIRSIAKP